MKDNEVIIYRLLTKVFVNKAYSGIALNETLTDALQASDRAYITRVFYGVIEKSVTFDYIIDILCRKKPKNSTIILIKIGLYLLRYTDTPEYAAINKTVALSKTVGKSAVSGFINACLRKSTEIQLDALKHKNLSERLSVRYSYPLWAVSLIIRDFGEEEAEAFLSCKKREDTHIRHNEIKITKEDFEKKLEELTKKRYQKIEKSKLGYYVSYDIMKNLPPNLFTAQSYASMLAVHSYLTKEEAKQHSIKAVLDLCGAPGGKSIYLKQRIPSLNITCCDIHPHKIKLIEDYSKRMSAELTTIQNDATIFRKEWQDRFDMVICDVPCSGLGLVNCKPDIILNKKEEDIHKLSSLQYAIISVAAKYVRNGGLLCYSTCTITKEENQAIIDRFIKENEDFEQCEINNGVFDSKGSLLLLPQHHDSDGFFIARIKRK